MGNIVTVPSRPTTVAAGSGTLNTVPRFGASGVLADSAITDDGSIITLGRNTVRMNTGTSLQYGSTQARLSSPADAQLLLSASNGTDQVSLFLGGTGTSHPKVVGVNSNTIAAFRADGVIRAGWQGAFYQTFDASDTSYVTRGLAGGVRLSSTGKFSWSDNSDGNAGTTDTYFTRTSAGLITAHGASAVIGGLRNKRNTQTTSGTTINLTAVMSGDHITTTGTATINLPAPTAGVNFTISTGSAHAATVATPSGAVYAAGASLGASAVSDASQGNTIYVWSDGTDYYALTSGTWT